MVRNEERSTNLDAQFGVEGEGEEKDLQGIR